MDELRIDGDVIYCKGLPVAKLLPDAVPSARIALEQFIRAANYEFSEQVHEGYR